MKRYAVFYAPVFRLQATLRHSRQRMKGPAALLTEQGKKIVIAELNHEAKQAGVQVGMTPTQGLARCPLLHIVLSNPGHQRSAEEILLHIANGLTPFFEASAPGIVTLELPLERSFTELELIQKCVEPLLHQGLQAQIGVAATPDLALLAAYSARPVRLVESASAFLAPLQIEALEPSSELLSIFFAWGIRTVGELLQLPKTEVCSRLGREALKLWERAQGGRGRPLKFIKPREFFSEHADLQNPLEMLDPLLFILRGFLEQISKRLEGSYFVAEKLRLELRFEKGPAYQKVFTLPQPTRDVELLFRMLHTHLENVRAEFPIVGLELAAKPIYPGKEQFDLLEKGVPDPYRLSETLSRLQAVLGDQRVGTPALECSAHPEAFHLEPYDLQARPIEAIEVPLVGIPWLKFRPRITAQIQFEDLKPVYLSSDPFTGPIQATTGPWLSEGHWWSGQHWAHEEWDAKTSEGVYRLLRTPQGCFLDGVYA